MRRPSYKLKLPSKATSSAGVICELNYYVLLGLPEGLRHFHNFI
jgi:hypothetical protein